MVCGFVYTLQLTAGASDIQHYANKVYAAQFKLKLLTPLAILDTRSGREVIC